MEHFYLLIMNNTKKVFFLVGPTCTGKSKVAIELVKKHPFEVINMDASTVYKNLDIGTDKPSKKILAQYVHHMIDIIDPDQTFNVNFYCKTVEVIINQIISKGKTPLIVGGTMMYFNRLLHGIDVLPERDNDEREFINYLKKTYDIRTIHNCLKFIDARSYDRINPNDSQRIERALEVYLITGRPMSSFFTNHKILNGNFINKVIFLLPKNRSSYHRKIRQRTTKIFNDGLIREVVELKKKYHIDSQSQSMKSIGYRQTMEYLDGKISESQLYEKCLFATRQLAKRQMTWMRKYKPDLEINIDHKSFVEIVDDIETNLHFG